MRRNHAQHVFKDEKKSGMGRAGVGEDGQRARVKKSGCLRVPEVRSEKHK